MLRVIGENVVIVEDTGVVTLWLCGSICSVIQ